MAGAVVSRQASTPCPRKTNSWGCTIQQPSDPHGQQCADEMKAKLKPGLKRKNLDVPHDALQAQLSAVATEFPNAAPAEQGQHGFILTKGPGVYLDLFSGSCRLACATELIRDCCAQTMGR